MAHTIHTTDVAIVGGGLAGSLATAMLGRAGIDCVLIDPNEVYPKDFRCEKFDGPQVEILRKTGLAEPVLRAATFDGTNWVARLGVVIERRKGDQHGIYYAPLVNTVRAQIPKRVPFIATKAQAIATGAERQTVTLANGEAVEARLVLLANGLSVSLRDQLHLEREIISRCHTVTVGFTMTSRGRDEFDFPALTYYAERPGDRAALITMFPIGSGMRANLFVYREFDDPWMQQMRRAPQEALDGVMPGLRRLIGDFDIDGRVEIRPIDLYVTHGHLQPGVVLAGDAFATSCPAAGTGARKVLTDVERLCNVHIPRWLATPGMGEGKIAAFYDDPVKRACDDFAAEKAHQLKAFSLDTSLSGRLRRLSKFAGQAARGTVRGSLPRRPITTSDGVLLGTR
jgi:2-polyprenyl-6-methoxyphenol hydroxylase-like FAD-dependent oxidoreductase